MTLKEAIETVENGGFWDECIIPCDNDAVLKFHTALDIMIAELQTRQGPVKLDRSRWSGCERCTSGLPEKGFPHEFWIDDGVIYYSDTEFGWEGELISYCPFCGRPLTEDAWAELERRMNGETD